MAPAGICGAGGSLPLLDVLVVVVLEEDKVEVVAGPSRSSNHTHTEAMPKHDKFEPDTPGAGDAGGSVGGSFASSRRAMTKPYWKA